MFSTVAAAEMRIPAPVAQVGSMYWLAVSIETWTPWYLVTYRAGEGDESHLSTMCVAWETSLFDMLNSASVEAIYCLVPSYDKLGDWRMSEVLEVREPSDRSKRHGPLLFKFAGGGAAVDARHEPIDDDVFQDAMTLFKKQP
jgi:hypothetical protein